MAEYLLAYRGGSLPEGDEAQAQVLGAWTAWFTAIGGAVADPGNPSTVSRTIAVDGTAGSVGPAALSGYTILNAESLDAAVALASSRPVLAGGASIEVAETIDVIEPPRGGRCACGRAGRFTPAAAPPRPAPRPRAGPARLRGA